MAETFAESRRRHDERYWADVWSEAGQRVTTAATIAGVGRSKARDYLRRLGIYVPPSVEVPGSGTLATLMRWPLVREMLGRRVTVHELDTLTPAQLVATNDWLVALARKGHHQARAVPGFLLQGRKR